MDTPDAPARDIPWLARQSVRAGGRPGAMLWGFSLLLTTLAIGFAEAARHGGSAEAAQGAVAATVVAAGVWGVGAVFVLRRAGAALELLERGRLAAAELDSRVLVRRNKEGAVSQSHRDRFVFVTASGERHVLETSSPAHRPLAERQAVLYLPEAPGDAELIVQLAVDVELVDAETIRVVPRWWYPWVAALPWLALAGIGAAIWRLVGS